MGYAPVSISEANTGLNKELKIPGFGNKVKLKDLAIFSRQFATMINSGLSLLRALSILAEQTENKELARVLARGPQRRRGRRRAVAGHGQALPKVFPPLMVNMMQGRRGRRFPRRGAAADRGELRVRGQAARQDQVRDDLPGRGRSCIAIIALIGMLLFIVPSFAKMFGSLGGKLPAPTQILVDLSHVDEVHPAVMIVGAGRRQSSVWNKVKHQRAGPQGRRPVEAEVPVFGMLVPEDRAQPLRPQPGHHDVVPACRSCRASTSSPTRPATWYYHRGGPRRAGQRPQRRVAHRSR